MDSKPKKGGVIIREHALFGISAHEPAWEKDSELQGTHAE